MSRCVDGIIFLDTLGLWYYFLMQFYRYILILKFNFDLDREALHFISYNIAIGVQF